ncbi:MAG: S8 family serine peptidase [candidate division Zixibacteria bacterium]|nr:S8 family serine peptidase [candidate division Zixibacteria bacterium]
MQFKRVLLIALACLTLSAASAMTVKKTQESIPAENNSTFLKARSLPVKPSTISISPEAQIDYVVVKMVQGTRLRTTSAGLISLGGKDILGAKQIVSEKGILTVSPLFSENSERLERRKYLLERKCGRELADFNNYFSIPVSSPAEAEELVNRLNQLSEVEIAYPRPRSVLAVDISPPTPTIVDSQTYLTPGPEGVDAEYGWTIAGGDGSGVTICDIEGAWKLDHEDIELPSEAVMGGDTSLGIDWRNHGTATIGTMVGKDNGYGVTGIVPGAEMKMVSHYGQNSDADAIMTAVDSLDAGDVIVIVIQTPGPRYNFQVRPDQLGYVCIEYHQAEFDAIQYAWAKGIIVIEAAGNGAENFNDAIYENRFDTTFRNSHAIIIGAGAPPSGNYGTDRKVLDFSNYGPRVNVQGYGREIYTCGYGDVFDGDGDERQFYTGLYGGTSGAAPIVAGAVASLQGIHKSRYSGMTMSSDRMRDLLIATGNPQQDFPTYHIGPRPDIQAADSAMPGPLDLQMHPIYLDTAIEVGSQVSVPLTLLNGSNTNSIDFQITVADSLAKILQSEWLSVSTSSGVIPPSDSIIIDVILDASIIEDRTWTYKGVLEVEFGISGSGLDEKSYFPVYLAVPCGDTTYSFSASFQPDGPEFDWYDLTAIGLEIPTYSWYTTGDQSDSLDDGTAGPYLIGFDFPFYDTTYNYVYIGVNGGVSFTEENINVNGMFSDIDIPNPPFSTLIAPFWNDLDIGSTTGHGSVYFYRLIRNEGFVIQYNQVGRYGHDDDTLTTFQVILYRNGNVKFQYLSVGSYDLADSAVISISEYDCQSHPFFIRSNPPENIVTDSSAVLYDYIHVIWEMAGDANYDGQVNVGDAVYIINYVFRGGPPPQKMAEGDANCDGDVNIGDAVYIINYVFRGGTEPCLYEL